MEHWLVWTYNILDGKIFSFTEQLCSKEQVNRQSATFYFKSLISVEGSGWVGVTQSSVSVVVKVTWFFFFFNEPLLSPLCQYSGYVPTPFTACYSENTCSNLKDQKQP